MVILKPISRKSFQKDIFAQILLSNQHLVREIKEQDHVTIGAAHKRRLQPYVTWGRAEPDRRYGSCLRFLYVGGLVQTKPLMRVLTAKATSKYGSSACIQSHRNPFWVQGI